MSADLPDAFREAMAHVVSPVTVVTTMVDGVAYGSTVSAFASLSVHPPMVMLALDDRGAFISHARAAGRIGVNVLSQTQAETALVFASRGRTDRFDAVEWVADEGLPRLVGTAAWLRCDDVQFLPGGDHTVLLATVTAAETYGPDGLAYYRRSFRSLDAQ